MFDYFSTKIKRNITLMILLVLAVQLVVIFLLYSTFLRMDYINKTTHISGKFADYVELRLRMVEESALLFMDGQDLAEGILSRSPVIITKLREFLATNIDICDIFLYTDADAFFYSNENQSLFEYYIHAARSSGETTISSRKWEVYSRPSSGGAHLLYSQPVKNGETIMGRLVLDVSTTSFFEVLSTYNNAFTDNAAALIRFSDSGYLSLAPQGLDESLLKINAPFSLTPYSQTDRSTYICSHPLERFGLCVQMLNSLYPITQKSGLMASVLAGIFFIASVLVPWGITAYSKYLTRHLENLNGKIQGFLKDEGINKEGEALSQ